MKKMMFTSFALMAVLVIGLFGIFILLNNDDEEIETAEVSSQNNATQQPADQTQADTNSTGLKSEYLGSYTIDEAEYGTTVTVSIDSGADSRTIIANALPNHSTGEFPNSGNPNTISEQQVSYTFPLTPTKASTVSQPRSPGVALNGVKFEPGTAETAACDDGTTHRIEAIQNVVDLGLDFNNAHVQPTGAYHYHGISEMLADLYDNGEDLVHIGFAADGYMFYYSKSGAYSPSYSLADGARATACADSRTGQAFDTEKDGALESDWTFNENLGDLDECNGTTIDGQYVYLVTDEYPYISRCLTGEFTESGPGAGGPPPR